jgi:molybdate transport system substrate-binding protein
VPAVRQKFHLSACADFRGQLFPIAIPVDLAAVLYIQFRMIEVIAHIRGHDLKSDKVQSFAKRVVAGETADLYILTKQSLDALSKEAKVAPGSEAAIASSEIAVVVKHGAPKPDISTPEAYKKALLAAKRISYSNPASGGASGVFVAKSLERMGIADQVKGKTHFPPPSGNSANLVVSGEAELAIQQKPEVMSATGVDVVGSPPGDLNKITLFSAGISTQAKEPNAAKALIKFLKTPEAAAVFRKRGLNPA